MVTTSPKFKISGKYIIYSASLLSPNKLNNTQLNTEADKPKTVCRKSKPFAMPRRSKYW